jgi:spoIIIJ-associated protein
MSRGTFEAATVEAALEAAAAEIGVPVSELEHEVVEKKEDFWGMGESTVVIKAWAHEETPAPVEQPAAPSETASDRADVSPMDDDQPAADAMEPPAAAAESVSSEADTAADSGAMAAVVPEPEAKPEREPEPERETKLERTPQAGSADAAEAGDVDPEEVGGMLAQIFHDMEFECTATVEAEDGGFLATIDGADKEAILEGNGRCLAALELLVNNAFRHKLPRGNKIRVDAGDFRNRRDEELSDLALQVAHSAKESGRTQETQPLNPYERRLVHLALAEDPAVTTRSRGSGFLKNVQVIPSGGGRPRGRRR